MPHLRKAEASDAGPLAVLAESTFRDAFGRQNTVEDMRLHCSATFGEALQLREIMAPDMLTLVTEADRQLTAYGQLRWGPAPPCVAAERPAEIYRLYVDRPWHGRGVAQSLMSALLAAAREGGADQVWLGVWEHNPRAIAFYVKCGFREVGDHEFLLGLDRQRDLVMARGPRFAQPLLPLSANSGRQSGLADGSETRTSSPKGTRKPNKEHVR